MLTNLIIPKPKNVNCYINIKLNYNTYYKYYNKINIK